MHCGTVGLVGPKADASFSLFLWTATQGTQLGSETIFE